MKLVVSDVDGTILKSGEDVLNENIITIIRELTKRGILFAAASGRSYFDLRRIFQSVEADIIFIPNDGAAIFYKGSALCYFPIEHALGFEFMKDIYQNTEAEVVLYGGDMTFILPKSKEFEDMMCRMTNAPIRKVHCMDRVQAEYLKIACYHKTDVGKQLEDYLPYWIEKLHLSYVSQNWIEFTSCSVHKATAVEKIMDIFGIRREEVMAFGDNDNDKEMLSLAGTAYAMKGAKAEIKQLCAYETEDVAETLYQLFLKS